MKDAMLSEAGACPICGEALARTLLTIREPDRFEVHLGIEREGYLRHWMQCGGCGAAINVYSEGVLEKLETIGAGYYEVDFKSSTIRQKFSDVMALPAGRSDNALRVGRIRCFLAEWSVRTDDRQPRALDIGAGTGVFLSRFLTDEAKSGRTWSAVAVEPDAVAAAHLRDLGRFEVIEGLYSKDSGLGEFELCTLNKVIEHLAAPVELLRHASAALLPGIGILYVEVPAIETIFCRPPNDNILGSLHRQLYDIESLNAALCKAGLVVLRIERLFEPSGKISLAGFAIRPEAADARRGGSAE